jgi:very-short-patch-repair endonuclease
VGEGSAARGLLARHAARRAQGIPTLSVLVGDVARVVPWLTEAQAERHATVVTTRETAASALVRDLLRALNEREDISGLAFARVAALLGEPVEALYAAWGARGVRERRLWLAQLETNPRCRTALGALRWLGVLSASDRASLLARARAAVGALEPLGALASLREFVALDRWPLLCAEDALAAAGGLVETALLMPNLPLAAVCSAQDAAMLLTTGEGREHTLLVEGLVRLELAALDAVPGATGCLSEPTPQVTASLARLQVEAETLMANMRGTPAAHSVEAGEMSERARSLAERLLYERLQAAPDTHELFELNGQMSFKFGKRPAEIDLVSRRLRLALEIDGYHHFTGPDAYRRDRRKDILLQAQGFWVVRVLASDVIEQIECVMRDISGWIAERRKALQNEEAT